MEKKSWLKSNDFWKTFISIFLLIASIAVTVLMGTSLIMKHQQNQKSGQVLQEIQEELDLPQYQVDESFFEQYEPEAPMDENQEMLLEIPK